MAEVYLAPDGDFATMHYDVTGTIELGDGAIWAGDHWEWNEVQHLLDARCPKCSSPEPCQQQVQLFPLRGHVLVVHDVDDIVPFAEA